MNTELFAMVNRNHDRKVSRAKKKEKVTLEDVAFLFIVPIACLLMALVENIL
jgi:hypothetical protein